MDVYLLNKSNKIDITQIITSLTISGEYRSCCRNLDFGIIKNQTDLNTHIVSINLGDNIQVMDNGKTLFHGIVWSRDKISDGNEINISCRDFGIYLIKNVASYKFTNMTPEAIANKLCKDFKLNIGDIAPTYIPISRNYLGYTLYDIIMSSYTLANDKKYMCIFKGDKFNIVEKGLIKGTPLKSGMNLLTSSVSETLNDMVNRVNIYNEDDVLIKPVENSSNISLYGLMTEYIKVYDDKENYNLKAQKMLNGITQKISVTNFGDTSYITGNAVVVTEPYQGLKGLFFIDSDNHNWKNGIYTNKLTLNFKNLMDEKEGGSIG